MKNIHAELFHTMNKGCEAAKKVPSKGSLGTDIRKVCTSYISYITMVLIHQFECVCVFCPENGIIKSDRVYEVMLVTDRAHFSRCNPYMDSPQSIGKLQSRIINLLAQCRCLMWPKLSEIKFLVSVFAALQAYQPLYFPCLSETKGFD